MKTLTLIDKAFLLKRTPLFSALDLDLLLTIADKLGLVLFDAQEEIFVTGEEANRMYFVVKGEVEIYSSPRTYICKLEQGNFFGEESLFNNKPRSYAAVTPIQTHVLTLSRTNLYAVISECPSVAIGFLQVYTSTFDCRFLKNSEKTS